MRCKVKVHFSEPGHLLRLYLYLYLSGTWTLSPPPGQFLPPQSRLFLTNQVELTWDETDHERVTAMNRKFNKEELLDMDFNAYLASSSEEEGLELEEEEQEDDVSEAGGETSPW